MLDIDTFTLGYRVDLDISHLEQFEAEFGINIPGQYKQYLIQCNGLMPQETVVGGDQDYVVAEMFAFGKKQTQLSLKEEYKNAFGIFGNKNYLPFARDVFGGRFALNCLTGAVFYYSPDYDEITELTKSFYEFVDNLSEDKDLDRSEDSDTVRHIENGDTEKIR